MAINSHAELRRLLDQIQSLDASDVADIVGSAHYNANGRLDGIYSGSLVAKASPSEIAAFLGAAGAYHPDYGGTINGDVVGPNVYRPANPCAARNDNSSANAAEAARRVCALKL
jgi:hypothetical protein